MKTKLLFTFIFVICPLANYSQNPEKISSVPTFKHQIGFQILPYWTKNVGYTDIIYDLRYGNKISKSFTIGAEVSETVPRLFMNYSQTYDFKGGMYARYSILNQKRIQGFIEGSPFYSHRYFKGLEQLAFYSRKNTLGLYLGPGATIYTKDRRLSLDVYYKFYIKPTSFFYWQNNWISYKINYNF